LVPEGPRATGKRKAGSITSGYLGKRGKDLLLSELACHKQVLASVLRLTIWTTPAPYLAKAQSVATVRCVVTRGPARTSQLT